MLILRIDTSSDRQRYDSYVQDKSDRQITDFSTWHSFVEKQTKTKVYDVGVSDSEVQVGRMSLGLVKHKIFGSYLTSAPYGGLGGFLSDGVESTQALLAESVELCIENNADYVQIRAQSFDFQLEDWRNGHEYGTYLVPLDTEDSLWKETLSATVRNQTRKGVKNGYSAQASWSRELTVETWRILSIGMRELGSPFHSRAYIKSLIGLQDFEVLQILLLDNDQKPAGVTISLINKDKAFLLYSIVLNAHKKHCAGNVLLWETMKNLLGVAKMLDLGRSISGSSHEHFKLRWGAQKIAFQSIYWSRTQKEISMPSPDDTKYKFAATCWRRLPMGVTNSLGPYLIRGIA